MESFLYKHRKKIVVAAAVLVLCLIGLGVYRIVWNNIHSATVSILVSPSIAKVKIGDDEYSAIGEYKIAPGTYAVEVYADGFQSKNSELVAVRDELAEVTLYLEPSDGNENWYEEHDEGTLLGGIKNSLAQDNFEKLKKENPILERLPLEVDYYTKNYGKYIKYTVTYDLSEDSTSFKLVITDYTGGNYDDALAKLAARGVTADQYEIVYNDVSAEWGRPGRAE